MIPGQNVKIDASLKVLSDEPWLDLSTSLNAHIYPVGGACGTAGGEIFYIRVGSGDQPKSASITGDAEDAKVPSYGFRNSRETNRFAVNVCLFTGLGHGGETRYIYEWVPTTTIPETTPTTIGSDFGIPGGTSISSNGNIGVVSNNPTSPPTFTLTDTYQIISITNYHWNNAKGASPGTIGLKDSTGKTYGPWSVTTRSGQGGVPNAYWDAKPDIILGPGTYTVIDSDTSTWSHNSESKNQGMSIIKGTLISSTPTPTPAATPTPETKSWHSVITFSGSDDKTTQPFTIKGDEWRVKWSIRGDPDYTYFYVFVYPGGQTRGSVSNWNCAKSPGGDTQYIYEGAGDYYFDIGAANLYSWKLEVEDYY